MDIGLFIVVMLVVYVVPELLKRFKKKRTYQYPEFPPAGESTGGGVPGTLTQGTKPPPVPVYASEEGAPGDEGDPDWAMRQVAPVLAVADLGNVPAGASSVNAQNAMQGIIWAEIIAPPVSLRRKNQTLRRY